MREPWQFFWATGRSRSFLDNAPTYLTFLALGQGLHLPGEVVGVPHRSWPRSASAPCSWGRTPTSATRPNFMVKAIAEAGRVRMPSFFAYMLVQRRDSAPGVRRRDLAVLQGLRAIRADPRAHRGCGTRVRELSSWPCGTGYCGPSLHARGVDDPEVCRPDARPRIGTGATGRSRRSSRSPAHPALLLPVPPSSAPWEPHWSAATPVEAADSASAGERDPNRPAEERETQRSWHGMRLAAEAPGARGSQLGDGWPPDAAAPELRPVRGGPAHLGRSRGRKRANPDRIT